MAKRFSLKPDKPVNREAPIQDAVQHYLSLCGWTHLRTFPGRWVPWGETLASRHGGFMPRPRTLHESHLPDILAVKADAATGVPGGARVLWVEVKKPGERPDADQTRMHERLRRAGFVVIWCDGMAAGEGVEPFLRSYQKVFGGG